MRLMTFIHHTAPWFHPKKYTLPFVLLKASEKFQYYKFVVFTSGGKKTHISASPKTILPQTHNVSYVFWVLLILRTTHSCIATASTESEGFGYFSFSGYCDFDSVVKLHKHVADNDIN